jgi:hypothetical protein
MPPRNRRPVRTGHERSGGIGEEDDRHQDPRLAPVDRKTGAVNVVIETPRNCRNKFKLDEKLGLFRLNSVLPAGWPEQRSSSAWC